MKPVPNSVGRKRNQSSPKFPFRRGSLVLCIATLGCSAAVLLHLGFWRQNPVKVTTKSAQISEPKPATFKDLLALSPAEVERCDIARMNLLCAEGLRGAENLSVESFLSRLDGIVKHVELETRRHYYRFQNNKAEFNHSEGFFRMLLMAVTLQEDLALHYNPERITAVGVFEPNDVFFADCRDVFVHGMIAEDRRMGTCASMPVLYVAIGRRLGYACQAHDDCYDTCGVPKAQCDQRFCDEMQEICNQTPWYSRADCRSSARTFCWAVRRHGQNAYNDAQAAGCARCPAPPLRPRQPATPRHP